MKKIALILGGLMLSASALAEGDVANPERGKEIYEKTEKCLECHEKGEYFGAKAKNIGELDSWVRGCDIRFKTNWYDPEVKDVIAYLNQEYYKFPIEAAPDAEPQEKQENLDLLPTVQQDEAEK